MFMMMIKSGECSHLHGSVSKLNIIWSSILDVGADFVLGCALLAVPLIIDRNCSPKSLLMSSSLALSLRPYGYLILNVFIQWFSVSSLFFPWTHFEHTLPLTLPWLSNISSILIENENPAQSFWKCLTIYSKPDFAVRWISIRLRDGRAVSPTYWMLQVLHLSILIKLLLWHEMFSPEWLIIVYFFWLHLI